MGRRKHVVRIPVTPTLRARLTENARARGISRSAYLAQLLARALEEPAAASSPPASRLPPPPR
jgi:hypothetical protein